MAASRVISLGSIGVDVEMRGDGWPRFGTSREAGTFKLAGGGKAANVAYVARRLGVTTQLEGHVGDDGLAADALRTVRDTGVDLTGTKVIAGCPTGLAVVLVRSDGEKAIIAADNANQIWSDRDVSDVLAILASPADESILVEGQNVIDAARFAVAAATLKVRSFGAQTWQPSRRDIEALVTMVR